MKANAFLHDERGENDAMKQIAVGGILVAIAFVVVLTIFPILTAAVNTAQDDANSSSTLDSLLSLIPLVFVAALVIAGVGFLIAGVRGL